MAAPNPITPCRNPWASTMTSRERFNAQMHYQPIDRCFNMEFGYWEENFTSWDAFVENGITNNSQAHAFFNFDRIEGVHLNTWLSPYFPCEIIEERETTVIRRDSQGLLVEEPKDGHATIPRCIGSSVVTPDDWKRVKEERLSRDNPDRQVDLDALKAQHPTDRDYPLGIHAGSMIGMIRNLLTVEGLAYAMYDYPDMVEDMVEQCCLLVEDAIDIALPAIDFDYASGWEDICFKNGPLVSLDFFKNVVAPRYKRIHKKLEAHGIDLWYTDCDGDVRPILPTLMENGINCLFPFEVMGCAHPGELLDDYGKDLRIMGGVDKIQLAKGKDAIQAYLESLVPYVERGGYIPFCDHRCPPDVSYENYIYYLDLKEKLFGTLR